MIRVIGRILIASFHNVSASPSLSRSFPNTFTLSNVYFSPFSPVVINVCSVAVTASPMKHAECWQSRFFLENGGR